jgi:hypothetical protein
MLPLWQVFMGVIVARAADDVVGWSTNDHEGIAAIMAWQFTDQVSTVNA